MDIDVGVMIFIEIYCIELYINRYDLKWKYLVIFLKFLISCVICLVC